MPCYNCGYKTSVVSKDDIGWLCEWCSDRELRNPIVELLIKEFNYYDIAFKKHKDIDDFKIAQELSKILRDGADDTN